MVSWCMWCIISAHSRRSSTVNVYVRTRIHAYNTNMAKTKNYDEMIDKLKRKRRWMTLNLGNNSPVARNDLLLASYRWWTVQLTQTKLEVERRKCTFLFPVVHYFLSSMCFMRREERRGRERERIRVWEGKKGRIRCRQTDSQIIGSLLSFASSSFLIFTS